MSPARAALLAEVEGRIDRFFAESTERSATHSPQYQDLWRELHAAATGGKRLRPRLVVSAAPLLGDADTDAVVAIATAVELLHTALLLHDDVIDGDVERRGTQNLVGSFADDARRVGLGDAAARRWGETAAILAGDLLLTAAVRMTATVDLDQERRRRLIDLVDESIYRAAAGELADVAYASGLAIPSEAQIRAMMADKTAHYSLELPLRAAAILAGAPDALGDQLGEIGRSLGIVFQMRDDLLGVFGSSDETGKSNSSDLREGKQTILVALARDTREWSQSAELFGSDDLDEADAQRLRDALERSGARERFEAAIRDERDHVGRLIESADLPSELAELLEAEAGLAAERRA